jgi:hypothetical protein
VNTYFYLTTMMQKSEFYKLKKTLVGETAPSRSSQLSSISPLDRRRRKRFEHPIHSKEGGAIQDEIGTKDETVTATVSSSLEEEAFISIGIDLGTT